MHLGVWADRCTGAPYLGQHCRLPHAERRTIHTGIAVAEILEKVPVCITENSPSVVLEIWRDEDFGYAICAWYKTDEVLTALHELLDFSLNPHQCSISSRSPRVAHNEIPLLGFLRQVGSYSRLGSFIRVAWREFHKKLRCRCNRVWFHCHLSRWSSVSRELTPHAPNCADRQSGLKDGN